MYKLLRDLLFLLPAETSHHLTLNSLRLLSKTGVLGKSQALTGRPVNVMGIDFPNPVGLAAGLDKNGEYIDAMAALGFGFIEIGTVTPRPQSGNPLPRLFRLPEAKGIINRMGFNNHGLDYLLGQVENKRYSGVLGINIGKNFDTPVERALDDYLIGLRRVYAHADYITVNISSPNTPGLRNLQNAEALQTLLSGLKTEQQVLAEQYGHYVPVAVKVAPDLTAEQISEMADIFLHNAIDGLIATNTTLDKSAVSDLNYGDEQGGLSGQPLTQQSTGIIASFYRRLGDDVPIIGVGGIMRAEDAVAKLKAGAKLVQLYSGFIYGGPALIKACVAASDS